MYSKLKKYLLLSVLTVSAFNLTGASEPGISVQTTVDTTIATVGDRLNLRIKLSYPAGTTFQLPELQGNLDKFEIVDNQLSTPQRRGDLIQQEWQLVLAVFDTGKITIPALELLARKASDTTQVWRFQTSPQVITVYSVLAPGSRELKDIKPPFRLRSYLPWRWVILLLLLGGIVTGAVFYYRAWKRRHPPIVLNETYLDPPHVVALRQLQELLQRKPETMDERRSFYFALSQILRLYLERRFFIRALEMTTGEIKMVLPELEIEPRPATDIVTLLNDLDLIKYTGIDPDPNNINQSANQAIKIIEQTKRESFLRRTM